MKSFKRYSSKELPTYAHVPGKTIHPNKPGGHQYLQDEPQCSPINPKDALEHEVYCYGVDLFNLGFYWESHVAFEAAWNAHERRGEVADLLKALIKIAAAALKAKANQLKAAKGHLERARELLDGLVAQHTYFCGLELNAVFEMTFMLDEDFPELDHFLDRLKLILSERSD